MDKKTIQMVAVGAVILVIGILIGSYFGSSAPKSESPVATSTATVDTGTPPAPVTPVAPATTYTAPKVTTGTTLTRNQAYAFYSKEQRYTQLLDCIGFPNSFFFRVGTKIMVENKADSVANLVVWDKTYSIPGKGFKIITLDHAGVYEAMCNASIALRLQVSAQ